MTSFDVDFYIGRAVRRTRRPILCHRERPAGAVADLGSPEETSMEQHINEGGVESVSTSTHGGERMHLVSVYIHHELTPERAAELIALVESLVVRAVGTWAKL